MSIKGVKIIMTKFSHLSEEKRDIIEYLINTKKTFTYIGEAIGVDRTTVSKEIKNNRYIKSNFYSKLDSKGIEKAISDCEQLKKTPYVCNTCKNKTRCHKHHFLHNRNMGSSVDRYLRHQSRVRTVLHSAP